MGSTFRYDRTYQSFLLSCLISNSELWGASYSHIRPIDFGPPHLSFIYEQTLNYFTGFNLLPSVHSLSLFIEQRISDGVHMPPDVIGDMVTFLENLNRFVAVEEDIEFCKKTIPDFLLTVRYHMLHSTNLTPAQKVEELDSIRNDISLATPSKFHFVKALSPVPEEDSESGGRFFIGVRTVDGKLGNGILREEGCLVVAPTGVGKTNTLLGAMAATSRLGEHSLFIALEMNNTRLMNRYHAILGGIPINLFRQPKSKWPEHYRKRYDYLMSPECNLLRNRGSILNLSGKKCGFRDINAAIKAWKDSVYRDEGLDPDEVCTTVYVDWLKKISTEGVRVTKDSKNYDIYDQVCSELNNTWVNEKVRMFISTQATGASKGKELLTRLDIAEGKNFVNQMDASIALAPVMRDIAERDGLRVRTMIPDIGMSNEFESYKGVDVSMMSECNRTLNCCFIKTRDASEEDTFIPVYQDPTLKLWVNKEEADRRRRAIEADPTYGLP